MARGALFGVVAVGLLLAFSAPAGHPVVVFDEAHGQKFHIEGKAPLDLSALASLLKGHGAAPELWTKPLRPGTLDGVQGLVISGAFQPLSGDEVATVLRFVERGGRLAVMLHIPQPALVLLHELGIVVSNFPIRERENLVAKDPLNFSLTRVTPHAVTKDVPFFNVYGAFAFQREAKDLLPLATTSPKAFADRDGDGRLSAPDPIGSFDVVVAGSRGKGAFVVFGDDALFQNQFLIGNNHRLGMNLAKWLAAAP